MHGSLFFGGSLVAAVIAGTIALLAPCCVSVMLPAYFAATFQNRRALVAMTFVFAAGVATIILPLALGATALRRLILGHHSVVYGVGGTFMLGLGLYMLVGGTIRLPMPGRRATSSSGPLSIYTLGLFSGTASSCCAPVLAGIVALSGVASSFTLSMGLGLAYVFGMVAPLFAFSLFWERRDWQSSRLLRPRAIAWRIGPFRGTTSGTGLVGGLLLVAMGVATLTIAQQGNGMRMPRGWQASLSSRLAHYGHMLTRWLDWIPGWAASVGLLIALVLLARHAARQVGWTTTDKQEPDPPEPIDQGATLERHEA